ncbi:hypothetical protein ACH4U5_10250 [Streptomyces sp. NPDC020858]|uniref:hypothetical protein n=1 Tax=Streptomyces sp. NPDC020858 TaxID=3365097 RepID=UPI0037B149F6
MAREALRVLGRTYGEIDDSDGLLAGVASGLAEAHLEARQGHWRALAGLIRDRQPADAPTVYLRSIEPLRGQTGDRTYERLADLLLSARACHRALGTEDDFATYVAALRAGQRRKRKLMALLDRNGLWTPPRDTRDTSAPCPLRTGQGGLRGP